MNEQVELSKVVLSLNDVTVMQVALSVFLEAVKSETQAHESGEIVLTDDELQDNKMVQIEAQQLLDRFELMVSKAVGAGAVH